MKLQPVRGGFDRVMPFQRFELNGQNAIWG
jgi:hypothetical protein